VKYLLDIENNPSNTGLLSISILHTQRDGYPQEIPVSSTFKVEEMCLFLNNDSSENSVSFYVQFTVLFWNKILRNATLLGRTTAFRVLYLMTAENKANTTA
jgi:hypothetical protein